MTIDWRSVWVRAKAENDPSLLCGAIPYAGFVGLSVEPLAGQTLTCRLRYSESIIGNPTIPSLHGGVVGALMESTAILHLMWEADADVVPRTINMSFDFMRSGRPVDTFASGVVIKQGRRVANVRVEAWQDHRDRPIAAAHGHFLLTREFDHG
ncbi:MAG: PaaI family thioesterase [Alphaproteobacteria bacterium]|nr:PaaI family thioesterase [Alphaproteobacteria bacterium]